MTIEAISGIAASASPALEMGGRNATSSVDFSSVLGNGLQTLNTNLNASDQALRRMAAGEEIPLHDVMITMERAQLNLQFAVEVRNRLLEAYQQLTQMQL